MSAYGSGDVQRSDSESSPAGAGTPAEPVVIGRPGLNLHRTMRQFAGMLRRRFAAQIARNPKKFKKDAAHYLKRYLPPGPGRPAGDAVTKAIELRKQRLEWKQIYPQCILHHAQLSPAARRQAEYNLRAACRCRRNTARRRV